ncbi:MAG: hypothetical protein LKM30_05850 [Bacilli bacterium]|jgi:hypothetical protein|nr:hypothetical protein [Bacilli bacterium]
MMTTHCKGAVARIYPDKALTGRLSWKRVLLRRLLLSLADGLRKQGRPAFPASSVFER